jgi:hypothetical protein
MMRSTIIFVGIVVTIGAAVATLGLAAYGEPTWVSPAEIWLSAQLPAVHP